jgi:hypothetical protein
MSSNGGGFRHRYISILRCRTWHVWPENTDVVTNAISMPIDSKKGIILYASVHLVSYEKRPRAGTYSAKPTRPSASPIIWRGAMKSRYVAGGSVIQAPEDETAIKIHLEPAYKGEVDIQLHLATNDEIPEEELKEIVSSASFAVMAYINVRLSDLLTPVAPVQIRELTDKGMQGETSFFILAWERLTLDRDTLQDVAKQFARLFALPGLTDGQKTKVRIALELYAGHFYEHAATMRFLRLVMVLEALAVATPRPNFVTEILEQWHRQLGDIKSHLDPDSVEFASLESLERELFFRRDDSIRSQIRNLVHKALAADGNQDAADMARQALWVYDQRSRLVHEGTMPTADLTKAEQTVGQIVRAVLGSISRMTESDANTVFGERRAAPVK